MRRIYLVALVVGMTAANSIIEFPALAGGLTSPFRSDSYQGLGAADIKLMNGAIVDALEQRKPGAVSDWSDEATGHAGRVTILRTYQRGTTPCGEVRHVFTKGGGYSYKLPYCLQANGSWKIQF